jgi:hypothetical protein
MTFLESMMTNYVDMDLSMKGKTLIMDQIFVIVVDAVNTNTTDVMKKALENKIN